jgi:hypothetical protein
MTLRNNPVKRLVVVKMDNGRLQISVVGEYANTLRFREVGQRIAVDKSAVRENK